MAASVRVSQIIEVRYLLGNPRLTPSGKERRYWAAACSWKAIGQCGHKHRTEAAAERCVKPLIAKYLAYRRVKLRRTCHCGPNECCRMCQHVGGNGADRLRRES